MVRTVEIPNHTLLHQKLWQSEYPPGSGSDYYYYGSIIEEKNEILCELLKCMELDKLSKVGDNTYIISSVLLYSRSFCLFVTPERVNNNIS